MSMPLVALCADEESLRTPELLGLGGENLLSQQWLRVFSSAEQAREFLKHDGSIQEVWVASNNEIAPINLAAAIKSDRRERRVCMLSAQESGSLKSRASAAGIDASLTRQAFIERYALCKQIAMSAASSGQQNAHQASPAAATQAVQTPVRADVAQGRSYAPPPAAQTLTQVHAQPYGRSALEDFCFRW